jgi:hypothetical protein
MKKQLVYEMKKRAGKINWTLLIFMVFVLNSKLPVKVAAVLVMSIVHWKFFSIRDFFRQRYLFFYFGLVAIGIINLLLQTNGNTFPGRVTATIGISFWMMSALIAYTVNTIVKKEEAQQLHQTVCTFFILHLSVVYINLMMIMFETGSINPYLYKGLNQKYYISTGDFITGITFDSPVTTAFICSFGLLYFFYRKRFLLSMACMGGILLMASNFNNLILLCILVFAFVFYSNRVQKSFIIIYLAMLVVFMARVSPQNNEHVGRIFYQLIDKPYDLPPPVLYTMDELKKLPDSILTAEQQRKKHAKNYIDSMSAIRLGADLLVTEKADLEKNHTVASARAQDTNFYEFRESRGTEEKINRFVQFLNRSYGANKRDSLAGLYNWKHPGKWIAGKQLFNFFKHHPQKILMGDGVGNFSSRIAFKATLLNIAGRYPEKLKYIHPDFLNNHLYLYLFYHSQDQSKHEASNTPDSVYYQVSGEYGISGLVLLLFFYFGFFIRHIRNRSFGLPMLFLLAGAFFAEYWFEQFSIVILFELLFFLDMKDLRREEQHE